jgi:hypothetical protein
MERWKNKYIEKSASSWLKIHNCLRMHGQQNVKKVSDKICEGNQNTHFIFSNFFLPKNHAVYEIMWKNIVERGMPQMAIRRMRIACWILKATHIHTQNM